VLFLAETEKVTDLQIDVSHLLPLPECPVRKDGYEWRGEPSEAGPPVGRRRRVISMESYAILFRMPRTGARGGFT